MTGTILPKGIKLHHLLCLNIFEQRMTEIDVNIPWRRCSTRPLGPSMIIINKPWRDFLTRLTTHKSQRFRFL